MNDHHRNIHINIARHFKINKFLLECNKLMDGVYIEEITENHNDRNIRFQAKLTCLYANPSYWSPSPAFFEIVMKAGKKYFDIENIDDFTWNNTKTIFRIDKEKLGYGYINLSK